MIITQATLTYFQFCPNFTLTLSVFWIECSCVGQWCCHCETLHDAYCQDSSVFCFCFVLFSLNFFELLQYVPPHEVRFTLIKRSSGWTINPSGVLLSLPDRLSFPSAAKFVNNWTVKLEILQQKHAENKTEFNYKVKCSFYTNYISTMKKNMKNH